MSYEQGFMDKCAEYGIDGVELVKTAGGWEGVQEFFKGLYGAPRHVLSRHRGIKDLRGTIGRAHVAPIDELVGDVVGARSALKRPELSDEALEALRTELTELRGLTSGGEDQIREAIREAAQFADVPTSRIAGEAVGDLGMLAAPVGGAAYLINKARGRDES